MRSDAELVKSCLKGEKGAFEMLVRRYERVVRASAMTVLSNRDRALDAAQEAFLKAYEKLPFLRKKEAFGPWLLKITRRCALNIVKRNKNLKPLETAYDCTVERQNGELDEEKLQLLAAVMNLPKSEQQVVMLRYFGGHKVQEVSDILGRNIGTVTKQLSRAHHRLHRILKDF